MTEQVLAAIYTTPTGITTKVYANTTVKDHKGNFILEVRPEYRIESATYFKTWKEVQQRFKAIVKRTNATIVTKDNVNDVGWY